MPTSRSRRKTAIKFVTPSGVVAVVAKDACRTAGCPSTEALSASCASQGTLARRGQRLIEFGPGGLLPVLKSPC